MTIIGLVTSNAILSYYKYNYDICPNIDKFIEEIKSGEISQGNLIY